MKILKNYHFDQTQCIAVSFQGKLIVIETSNILYCTAQGNYAVFNLTDNQSYITADNLGCIYRQLKDFGFLYIDKSTVINVRHIKTLSQERNPRVTLNGSIELKVARHRKSELMRMLF